MQQAMQEIIGQHKRPYGLFENSAASLLSLLATLVLPILVSCSGAVSSPTTPSTVPLTVSPSSAEILPGVSTTFTITGGYVVGLISVFQNGLRLVPADFTAADGNTVVLALPVPIGTEMFFTILSAVAFTSSVAKTGDTMTGPLVVNSTFSSQSTGDGISSIGTRNRIVNGEFKTNQRGNTTFVVGSNTYGPDRWFTGITGANLGGGVVSLATPYEQFPSYFQLNGAVGNTQALLAQRIESINSRDLAGGNAVASYWFYQSTGATVAISTTLLYANTTDNFATTTIIPAPAATNVPSGVWTKITHTFAIPTAATTGLQFITGLPSGLLANQAMAVGQVQLEAGSVATPFERIDYSRQLIQCQRYYQKYLAVLLSGYAGAGNFIYSDTIYPVAMRVVPTLNFYNISYSNTSAITNNGPIYANHIRLQTTITALGAGFAIADIELIAEL